MIEKLCEKLTQDQVDTYGLVLDAYGLPYSVKRSGSEWEIWVDEKIRDRAFELIAQYIEENPQALPTDAQETETYQKTFTGIWVCLILLACHIAVNMSGNVDKILRDYGASSHDSDIRHCGVQYHGCGCRLVDDIDDRDSGEPCQCGPISIRS